MAIPGATAKRILGVFREQGLLRPLREGKGRRSAIYSFPRLLNIAEGYKAFAEGPAVDAASAD